MDLSIIYVNWNSLDYLRASLKSIYETIHEVSFEVIVVDNASPEGGIEGLQESFPDLILVKLSNNEGFARANNLGFRHSRGNHILLLNPDTQVIGLAIPTMLEQAKMLPDAGIVGCRLLNSDRSVQLTAIQKFPTILNQLADVEYLQLKWPGCKLWDVAPLFESHIDATRVEVISGACMLLKREVFERVGLLSEEYFMYAEDIDLNYKVNRAGYTNYYVSTASIVHHGGKSSSRQGVSYWATVMKYRAMRRLFRKIRGPFYSSLYRLSIGCVAIARLVLLVAAFPLGFLGFDRQAISIATKKWMMILRWAVGAADVSV